MSTFNTEWITKEGKKIQVNFDTLTEEQEKFIKDLLYYADLGVSWGISESAGIIDKLEIERHLLLKKLNNK